jgi:hypothetical protein
MVGSGSLDFPLFGHGRRYVRFPPLFFGLTQRSNWILYFPRICPGRYLADTNVWIAVAYILAAFDISPPKNVTHEEMKEQEYIEGVV